MRAKVCVIPSSRSTDSKSKGPSHLNHRSGIAHTLLENAGDDDRKTSAKSTGKSRCRQVDETKSERSGLINRWSCAVEFCLVFGGHSLFIVSFLLYILVCLDRVTQIIADE